MFIKKNSCTSKLKLLAIAVSIVLSNLQLVYAIESEDCNKSHEECVSGVRKAWGYRDRFGDDAEYFETIAMIDGCKKAQEKCLEVAARHEANSKDKK